MKNCFFFSWIVVFNFQATAQNYFVTKNYDDPDVRFEVGAGAGFMNCITDLGGGKKSKPLHSVNWRNSKPAAGIYFSTIYKRALTLRFEFDFGNVNASDSILEPVKSHTTGRYERNLHFKTAINEIQLTTEIYPLACRDKASDYFLNPYVLLGTGFFSFEPKALLNGHWYSLAPLRTEGQGFREYPSQAIYKLGQFNLSTGAGLKYEINPTANAKLELNYRVLFTDYLDDVSTTYIDPDLFDSYLPVNQAGIARELYHRKKQLRPDHPQVGEQRGNLKRNDAYFSIMLKVGIILANQRL